MELMTTAEVAELLRHPDPNSAAGRAMVYRLVKKGMPDIKGTRPRLYCRHDVETWLRNRSAEPAASPATVTPPEDRRRRSKPGSLAAQIAEMRAELGS